MHLVYNPAGPSLPPEQTGLEAAYRKELGEHHGIVFNRLYALANMPIKRFGSMLISQGAFGAYLRLLKDNFSAANLDGIMCRELISVDWQGNLFDCDFNQMLGLAAGLRYGARAHLSDLLTLNPAGHPIRVADHCYGCTAGQGSSCGGALHLEAAAPRSETAA